MSTSASTHSSRTLWLLKGWRTFGSSAMRLTAGWRKPATDNCERSTVSMPLSEHYLDTQEQATPVDADGTARLLLADFSQVGFALLLGSAATTHVIGPRSDLDLAIYCTEPLSLDQRVSLVGAVEGLHGGVRCDLGFLNGAHPV